MYLMRVALIKSGGPEVYYWYDGSITYGGASPLSSNKTNHSLTLGSYTLTVGSN